MRPECIIVFGASGFVGGAVVRHLTDQGAHVVPTPAPRLSPVPADQIDSAINESADLVAALAGDMRGADAVVNCAGLADASNADESALLAANAALPGVLAKATAKAEVRRYIHVSSAAVQGRARILDDSRVTTPFSPYSRSKALGETAVFGQRPDSVVYRPPGVHGADRRVTRMTARIARSPFGFVSAPATAPTPQALIGNVSSAVSFLARTERVPPPIVAHPWEGISTADLLCLLGARPPHVLPRWLARAVVSALIAAGEVAPAMAANARRVEMLLFGQQQAQSWLSESGWLPPFGSDEWRELGHDLAHKAEA